jgi:hypothetical protein
MHLPLPSRRDWLALSAGGLAAPWFARLAHAAAGPPRERSCILLWMAGGPSQMDTFDLKPGHKNGGPFKEISTAVPGIKISEHLPGVARQMKNLAVIRSMTTAEGDHARATHLVHTGHLPRAPIEFPALGALVSRELGRLESELPAYVVVGGRRFVCGAEAPGSGYLGPEHAPLVVGGGEAPASPEALARALSVADLESPAEISPAQAALRRELLRELSAPFTRGRPDAAVRGVRAAYARAQRLMRGPAGRAFNLDEEPDRLRDAYGRSLFGQGCLLARRLVERGVRFVQVVLRTVPGAPTAWDTHTNNFEYVKRLSAVLDAGWSSLLGDLHDRGMLGSTLVAWMGEFGRTPRINLQAGRDHFPAAWSVVLGGGPLRGGQVVGKTSEDGMRVIDHPASAPDLLATICKAVGVDPWKTIRSNIGRPIRIVDLSAKPIAQVLP